MCTRNGGVTQCGCAQVSVTKELFAICGVSESRIVMVLRTWRLRTWRLRTWRVRTWRVRTWRLW